MFSLGDLSRALLMSTRLGSMDLITARKARPLVQLLPKSWTATPYLYKTAGWWVVSFWIHTAHDCFSEMPNQTREHLLPGTSLDPVQEGLYGFSMIPGNDGRLLIIRRCAGLRHVRVRAGWDGRQAGRGRELVPYVSCKLFNLGKRQIYFKLCMKSTWIITSVTEMK